jgi:hypothetical protein
METKDLEHLAELLAEVRRQCRYVYDFARGSLKDPELKGFARRVTSGLRPSGRHTPTTL